MQLAANALRAGEGVDWVGQYLERCFPSRVMNTSLSERSLITRFGLFSSY